LVRFLLGRPGGAWGTLRLGPLDDVWSAFAANFVVNRADWLRIGVAATSGGSQPLDALTEGVVKHIVCSDSALLAISVDTPAVLDTVEDAYRRLVRRTFIGIWIVKAVTPLMTVPPLLYLGILIVLNAEILGGGTLIGAITAALYLAAITVALLAATWIVLRHPSLTHAMRFWCALVTLVVLSLVVEVARPLDAANAWVWLVLAITSCILLALEAALLSIATWVGTIAICQTCTEGAIISTALMILNDCIDPARWANLGVRTDGIRRMHKLAKRYADDLRNRLRTGDVEADAAVTTMCNRIAIDIRMLKNSLANSRDADRLRVIEELSRHIPIVAAGNWGDLPIPPDSTKSGSGVTFETIALRAGEVLKTFGPIGFVMALQLSPLAPDRGLFDVLLSVAFVLLLIGVLPAYARNEVGFGLAERVLKIVGGLRKSGSDGGSDGESPTD
jgi:hypothetical protein